MVVTDPILRPDALKRARRKGLQGGRRNRIGGMGLLPMPSFHTTVRTDPYTAVPSNKLNS